MIEVLLMYYLIRQSFKYILFLHLNLFPIFGCALVFHFLNFFLPFFPPHTALLLVSPICGIESRHFGINKHFNQIF